MNTAIIVAVSVVFALLADGVLDRDQRRRWRARARARRLAAKRRDAFRLEADAFEECIVTLQRNRLDAIRRGYMSTAADISEEIERYRAQLRSLGR